MHSTILFPAMTKHSPPATPYPSIPLESKITPEVCSLS